ncbi:MAG: ArsR/SmtB family transcription factor [Candidatus Micrarchaeia archaeon]
MKDVVRQKVAETFSVFADETRLKIFEALEKRELCVFEICEKTGVSQSAVSHQMGILRKMDLVRSQKRGQKVYYRIADGHILCIVRDCLEHVLEKKRR